MIRPVMSNFLAASVCTPKRVYSELPRVGSLRLNDVKRAVFVGFGLINAAESTKLSSRKRRKPCMNEKSIGPNLPSAPRRKSLDRVLRFENSWNSFPPMWYVEKNGPLKR